MPEKEHCSNCHCSLDDVNPKYEEVDFDDLRKAIDRVELMFNSGKLKVDGSMCLLEYLHNYLCEQLLPDYQ